MENLQEKHISEYDFIMPAKCSQGKSSVQFYRNSSF